MLLDIGLNVLLGLALGTLGGLFGIGGGLIAIPVLGVLFGLDQQLAQGTALVMVVPNVLLAIWRYHQRNRIDWRHAAALAGASFVFAIVGAAVAVSLDAGRMRLAFVGFLLALAAYAVARVSAPGAWRWSAASFLAMAQRARCGGRGGGRAVRRGRCGDCHADPDQRIRHLAGGRPGAFAGAGCAEHWRYPGDLCTASAGQLAAGLAAGGRRPAQHQPGRAPCPRVTGRLLRLLFSGFLVASAVLLAMES